MRSLCAGAEGVSAIAALLRIVNAGGSGDMAGRRRHGQDDSSGRDEDKGGLPSDDAQVRAKNGFRVTGLSPSHY